VEIDSWRVVSGSAGSGSRLEIALRMFEPELVPAHSRQPYL
jgi:hypothetical protein